MSFLSSCVFTALRVLTLSLVTAAAASAQPFSVTLTGSMYNGSSIPCFGVKEGTITSTVTGGVAPYSYIWSNGEEQPDLAELAAGYYKLKVYDAEGAVTSAEITLTQPEAILVDPVLSKFANGHNISCFECNNGSIELDAQGGTPPYTVLWDDVPSTAFIRTGLAPKGYIAKVVDANGCKEDVRTLITQPERSDWTMSGNAGTNPTTQYIGSSDNKDVVFKANGQEVLRLLPGGQLKVFGATTEEGPLYRDADGTLRLGGPPMPTSSPTPSPCSPVLGPMPYWTLNGNAIAPVCPEVGLVPRMGTLTNDPLRLVTNGVERIHLTTEGKVGIGTSAPLNTLAVRTNADRAGVDLDNASSGASTSSELRFLKNGDQRWALGVDFGTNGGQDLYIWDHVAQQNRLTIDNTGRVAIGGGASTDQLVVNTALERSGITLNNTRTDANAHTEIRFMKNGAQRWSLGCDMEADGGQDFFLWDETATTSRLRVDAAGHVLIGDAVAQNSPLYKLYVEGGIVARDVKVTAGDFPDYVFATDYRLMSLGDVAHYIEQHGHLPHFPSAAEVQQQGGVEVGDLQLRLLRTVEEQQLYILQLEQRIKALEERRD